MQVIGKCQFLVYSVILVDYICATKVVLLNLRPESIEVSPYFVYVQAVLKDILEKFLPDDAHIRANGRVRGEIHILFSV